MKLFSLDLGNKQTKLKNDKHEYVLPSSFLNQANMPRNLGGQKSNRDIYNFSVPFSDDRFVWGQDIDLLHLDEYLVDTIMYGGNRYNSRAFKLLANFALGMLAKDYPSKNKVLEVTVSAGLPTEDYADPNCVKALIKALEGQHQITIDDQDLVVKVQTVYVLPQPIGTLYNELLDNEGYLTNKDMEDEKVGIVDIGGGTILIDTILNLELSGTNRHQYDTGIDDLYETIAGGINGHVSEFQLERELRKGNDQKRWSYRFSKNRQDDITKLVDSEIDRFTQRIIANVNSTLKNLDSIDTLLFTGGGSNLINKKMIVNNFENAIIVEDAEVANLRGFYKYGLSREDEEE